MNRIALLCLLLTTAAADELRIQWTIPAGGWIRCNPAGQIPVYLCDPHALDEVTGRTDSCLVLPGCIGVFVASGRSDFYYWLASRSMQAEFPERHDLAELVGDGAPDALIRNLKANVTP